MEAPLFRRRDLPHWDMPGAAFFVTACLEGSIPAEGLLDVKRIRATLARRQKPVDISDEEWRVSQWKMAFARLDEWLDIRPANRCLEQTELAKAVVQSMYYFAGIRYDLFSYVVMPSHIHWVFHPEPEWEQTVRAGGRTPREMVVYSLKRFTANACNRLRGTKGAFWQLESYDHWVRDSEEMERIIRYVEGNPVKAGLVSTPEEWPFSSAHDRAVTGVEFGMPLLRATS